MRQSQSTNNNNNQNSQPSANHSGQSPLSNLNNNSLTSPDDQSKSQRIHEILSKDKKFLADIEEALNLLDGMEKLYPKKSSISLLKPEGNTTERDRLIKQLSDSLINHGYQSAIAYYLRGKLKIDGSQYFQMAKALYKTHGKGLTPIQLEYIEFRLKFNKPELLTIADTPLPMDIWNSHILPYLTAGPYVEIIHGDPSEEQKNRVIAKAQPVPDENNQAVQSDPSQQNMKPSNQEVDASPTTINALKPVVNAYHLIINKNTQGKTYSIGFCDKDGKYAEAKVHDKCSLKNYLSSYPTSIDPNGSPITRDPELIRYLQDLIREENGHTAHSARDTAHFSQANTANFAFFRPELQKHAFKELLDAVVRSEYDRVEEVLKSHPELLLSKWKGTVTDKGIAERTFDENATAFKLAVWARDWIMWDKMLKAIPSHLKTEYEDDFRQQLLELQEKGLTYTLDNLKACGLRILDDEPSEVLKEDVCKRNAYLFIIDQKTGDCCLGFKDPETGQYKQCELDQLSDLKNRTNALQQALDDHRKIDHLPRCIIHDEPILALARKEIKQQGGQTEITVEKSYSHDLTPLSDALQKYNGYNWTNPQRIEHWCVLVGGTQRLLPAAIWNWWMHPDIDWRNISESTFNRNFPASYRPLFGDNSHLFSLAPFLGDKFAVSDRGRFLAGGSTAVGWLNSILPWEWTARSLSFLNHFILARNQKLYHLREILNITPPTHNHQIAK